MTRRPSNAVWIKNTMLLVQIAIFLLAVAARITPGPRTIDDAYITFRYARNLLAGEGFVYNPGEQVLGTTTPLYTLLLVSLGSLTGGVNAPFPEIALLINALADACTSVLLFNLGRRLGFGLAGLGAALVWAVLPFSVTFAIGGLETSLYVLLLVGMVNAHITDRHILASLLGALALLTRPDALILIGPLFFDRLLQILKERRQTLENKQIHPPRRSALVFEALAFLLPASVWIVFATNYFGSPIPHSITAKSLAYRLSPQDGLVRLIQHYATPFMEHLTFGILWLGVGMVLYPFLYLLGALQMGRKNPRIWPFLTYPWLYFGVFAVANPLIFRWYLTPPLPALIVTILVGMQKLVSDASNWIFHRLDKRSNPGNYERVKRLALVFFVVLAPIMLSVRDWTLHPEHGLGRPAPGMAWYQLELLYRQAAESLKPDLSHNGALPVLAAGDVGVLGFYSPTRILDTVGLNSPQSTRYYPLDPAYYVINYAIPPDLILEAKPDYLVILEVYGRGGLLKDPRFKQAYTLRQKIPTDIYGSDGMLIFARKSTP